MSDATIKFADAMREEGLSPPAVIVADGALRRFQGDRNRQASDAWYVLFDDGTPAGAYGDWRRSISKRWCAQPNQSLSSQEQALVRRRMEDAKRQRKEAERQRHAKAAERATSIWNKSESAPANHEYLCAKGISPHGIRAYKNTLIIPVQDASGNLCSLQFIGSNGEKKFLSNGKVQGSYFSLDEPSDTICICEGFATAVSVYEATKLATVAALNCGNLESVARALRAKFADAKIILCADDDIETEGNPGREKAKEAAEAVGGFVAVPQFGDQRPESCTDFNDLARHCGPEAVKDSIAVAEVATVAVAEGPASGKMGSNEWPDPQSLISTIEPEPYPLDALPPIILAAVEEVVSFAKAPIPLVASSALGSLSLVIQSHADIKRAEGLAGPVGLFFLTIAESGERKTTCDGYFTRVIRAYEEAKAEESKPEFAAYRADLSVWEAKRAAIVDAIKADTKKGRDTDLRERELGGHENNKPKQPKAHRLLRGDETPESLAFSLVQDWPSTGVVSSEAGIILGAHGMGKESLMRNLTLLSTLWDGGTFSVGRKTTDSFTVKGARLTMALQVQESTLQTFLSNSDGLARDTGFLARFLIAWPESTQGTRFFTEAPEHWPSLARFNNQITSILEKPVYWNGEGDGLVPPVFSFSTDAKAAWVRFHDLIESELSIGGELGDVRDVASKAADNAARLATLFQMFEHGVGGSVGLESFERASRIIAWHLNEARRFLGEAAIPIKLVNLRNLDRWLIDYCRNKQVSAVPRREVQRCGPNQLRFGDTLNRALDGLNEVGRVRVRRDGHRKDIQINPALVEQVLQ